MLGVREGMLNFETELTQLTPPLEGVVGQVSVAIIGEGILG